MVEGESQPMVVARADAAMYRAKRAGRDRIEVVGGHPRPRTVGPARRVYADAALAGDVVSTRDLVVNVNVSRCSSTTPASSTSSALHLHGHT